MSETIYLQLPWPPTANTYYRHVNGRVLISKDGRNYREAVVDLLKGAYETLRGRIAVKVFCHAPDFRRRDIANLEKCLMDSLTHAGIWVDDCQIDDLHMLRCEPVAGGMVKLEIREIADDDY